MLKNIYNEIIDKFGMGGRIITVNKLVYVVDRIITNIQRAVLLNWKLFGKLTLNIL